MPDYPELDPDLKLAVDAAHKVFASRLEAPLQRMFAAEGFPETLCHYTDFSGLKGILETQSLWATDSRTLNDGTEEQYGFKVVKDYLKARLGESPEGIQLDQAMAAHSSRNFATCFCEGANLLSMWKGYAGQGGGFCLEFDGRALLGSSFPPSFRSKSPTEMCCLSLKSPCWKPYGCLRKKASCKPSSHHHGRV